MFSSCRPVLAIDEMPSEAVIPIFRALGPLEAYLAELYNHNFGTIACAIWVDSEVLLL